MRAEVQVTAGNGLPGEVCQVPYPSIDVVAVGRGFQ